MSIDLAGTGAAIQAARLAAGLTQQQLADIAGLTRSSLANIEAGRQRTPSTKLATIAATLGTTTSQLLGENAVRESRIPTSLAAEIAGHQREVTRLLNGIAEAVADLVTASERGAQLLDRLAEHAEPRTTAGHHNGAENTPPTSTTNRRTP